MRQPIVIDTNVVLDLFIFADEEAKPLRARLDGGEFDWIATASMRTELERVLDYAHITSRMAYYRVTSADVLAAFDARTRIVPAAPSVPLICKDPDDQKFIDLAVEHQAWLVSKDKAVLKLRKRMEKVGVLAAPALRMLDQRAAAAIAQT